MAVAPLHFPYPFPDGKKRAKKRGQSSEEIRLCPLRVIV